jgi:hypothetical protein
MSGKVHLYDEGGNMSALCDALNPFELTDNHDLVTCRTCNRILAHRDRECMRLKTRGSKRRLSPDERDELAWLEEKQP